MKTNSILFLIALFLLACGGRQSDDQYATGEDDTLSNQERMEDRIREEPTAMATIAGASGSATNGTVNFTQTDDGKVKIDVQLIQISPGKHALHLHENGDCSASDATSAGGHWNPTDEPHGKRGEGQFHKGDITNLEVGDDQQVKWSDTIDGWTIGGPDSTNILNKAVIIHSGADDFTSQPSGKAGSRIACGVITQSGASTTR